MWFVLFIYLYALSTSNVCLLLNHKNCQRSPKIYPAKSQKKTPHLAGYWVGGKGRFCPNGPRHGHRSHGIWRLVRAWAVKDDQVVGLSIYYSFYLFFRPAVFEHCFGDGVYISFHNFCSRMLLPKMPSINAIGFVNVN